MDVSEIMAEIDGLDDAARQDLINTLGITPDTSVNNEPTEYVTMSDYADTIEHIDALTESIKQINSDYDAVVAENKRLRDDISHFIRTGVSPMPVKPQNPTDTLVDALF